MTITRQVLWITLFVSLMVGVSSCSHARASEVPKGLTTLVIEAYDLAIPVLVAMDNFYRLNGRLPHNGDEDWLDTLDEISDPKIGIGGVGTLMVSVTFDKADFGLNLQDLDNLFIRFEPKKGNGHLTWFCTSNLQYKAKYRSALQGMCKHGVAYPSQMRAKPSGSLRTQNNDPSTKIVNQKSTVKELLPGKWKSNEMVFEFATDGTYGVDTDTPQPKFGQYSVNDGNHVLLHQVESDGHRSRPAGYRVSISGNTLTMQPDRGQTAFRFTKVNGPTPSTVKINPPTTVPASMVVGEKSTVPKLLTAPEPVYPARALSRGIEGYVDVQFTIRPDGTTANPIVVFSTSSLFERSATKAVLDSRYEQSGKTTANVRERVKFAIPQ